MVERDPPHYLRALRSDTLPQRLAWFDCAAIRRTDGDGFRHSWAGGAAGTTHHTSRRGELRETLAPHNTPESLWQAIDAFCTGNRRVVMFGYDLPYQLRVSQSLRILPQLGWEVGKIVLESSSAWCSLKDGKRSLLICDLRSWVPVELGRIASDLGEAPLAASGHDVEPGWQLGMCMWRCRVVRMAVTRILDWLRREGMGPFRPTGSGQSYSAFRRSYLHHKLLVHDDTRRLGAERVAMWTGRCEAWRHGTLPHGRYVEMDMRAAYATIAAQCNVPTVARHHYRAPIPIRTICASHEHETLARVTITTRVPCAPTSHEGHTVWPIGTFHTWLWTPELRLAIEHADDIVAHEVYVYDSGPALRDFATFTLDAITPRSAYETPLIRRVLKHWSRCMIGRLGLRYRSWEPFGRSDRFDLRLVSYLDAEDGTTTDLLIAGHEWLILADMTEALESLPQVPSWIMSECRARLWRAIARVGQVNVVYVDTDSIIIRTTGADDEAHWVHDLGKQGWVHKGTYPWLTIHSPRNLSFENDRRVSGLPRSARQTAPLEYTGEVMRSIKESMRHGELDSIAELPRTFRLSASDTRRKHVIGGQTKPFTVNQPPSEVE